MTHVLVGLVVAVVVVVPFVLAFATLGTLIK